MNRFSTVCFLILAPFVALAQNPFTFRQTFWGMTRAGVLQAEAKRKPVSNKPDRVDFKGIALGESTVDLFYRFSEGYLTSAQYYYRPVRADQYLPVLLIGDLKEDLTEKYGEPVGLSELTPAELTEKAPAHHLHFGMFDGQGDWVQYG